MQETIEGRLPVSSQKIGEKTIECFKKMINPEVLENFIIEVSKTNKKRLRNHKLTNWEIVIKRKEWYTWKSDQQRCSLKKNYVKI